MKLVTYIFNLPWTVLGCLAVLISFPYRLEYLKETWTPIVWIKSFWWYSWIPGMKRIRAMAIGNIVLVGNIIDDRDIAHEFIHVEQYQRYPFIYPFLYIVEFIRTGYRKNKYEEEAYSKAENIYIET